jgi:hypothetical protein
MAELFGIDKATSQEGLDSEHHGKDRFELLSEFSH